LFEEIEQAAAKGQAVNALCQMTGLSRAGFYRARMPRQTSPVEMEIRDEMQKIALESAAYGYRRITVELQRRGFEINHKRVLRMMREDNLLCVRRRSFGGCKTICVNVLRIKQGERRNGNQERTTRRAAEGLPKTRGRDW
jgi:HTH-like domain